MEEIYFKDEAREKLFSGINKLERAVASTFGPDGSTVILTDDYGKSHSTKDGVSVARHINFRDPVENIGAQMIKEVAERTVDQAGDGTTTSIILANAFINNLKDFKPREVVKAFDEIIPKVIEQLKLNSRKLRSEDIKYVASISANNDIQIGDVIQQAFNHSSIVKVEKSNNLTDTVEFINGMSLPVSYFSKHFITDTKKAECNFDETNVLLLDGKLDNLKNFEAPLKSIAAKNEALLIVVEHVSENVLRLIETNVLNNDCKFCIIKAPGFAQHRKDLLQDLAHFTGATLISDFTKPQTTACLGKLKSIKVTKQSTTLVKNEEIEVDGLVADLNILKLHNIEDYDKELIQQRIENLTGKISVIKVGGGSELEMIERYDRYDDAVKATQCALEEGIVMGGGTALFRIATNNLERGRPIIEVAISKSLRVPHTQIYESGTVLVGNLFEQNIIDPLKVTRCALENAVSVAKTILTTNAIVLNERQWT